MAWTEEKPPNTNTATFHSSLKLCVLRGPGNVFLLMVGSFSPIVSGIMRGGQGKYAPIFATVEAFATFFFHANGFSLCPPYSLSEDEIWP